MARSSTPHLLVGPVGAGKTTYGHARATRDGAVFLDLDVWMVRLFGGDRRPEDDVVAWYLERRERCRGLAWDVALDALRSGSDVVLEFGLLTAADRHEFYAKASSHDVRLRVYVVDAPRDVRRERVIKRNAAPGPHTQIVPLEFFERASDMWQPPSESERSDHGLVDI
jgi:predicted kinase